MRNKYSDLSDFELRALAIAHMENLNGKRSTNCNLNGVVDAGESGEAVLLLASAYNARHPQPDVLPLPYTTHTRGV